MRPYMLWLTRVYGGSVNGYAKAFLAWPNVLDDWLRRCAEDRFRSESYPQRERQPKSIGRDSSIGTRTALENLRRAERQRADHGDVRAAGQGER